MCLVSTTGYDFEADGFSYVVASSQDIFPAQYFSHIEINISAVWLGILLKIVERQIYIII